MSPYREEDLKAQLDALDAKVAVLTDDRKVQSFWDRAAAAFGSALTVAAIIGGIVSVLFVVGWLGHGCQAGALEHERLSQERCASVCSAIGMSGGALVHEGGAPADDALFDCACGLGTRLVIIHCDGTVDGVDVTTGVRFHTEEE